MFGITSFAGSSLIDEVIAVEPYKYDLDADKYELKQTQDMLNELQSHLDYQRAKRDRR